MTWSDQQARALAAVFAALDREKVEWLVLRNWEGLPDKNASKDVDIGIDKADIARVHGLIETAVKAAGFDHVYAEDFQFARCLTFVGIFGECTQSIKVDLMDGLAFRGAHVFQFAGLVRNSRRINGFRVPDHVDNGVMLWMKPLLTGGIVKQKYVREILESATARPEAFKDAMRNAIGAKWASRVWPVITKGELSNTIPMKRSLRIAAWGTAFERNTVQTLKATLHHLLAEIARRARRGPATFFAVVGPDGVGKTTFIENLSGELAHLRVKDREEIRVRHFRPHILPNLKRLLTGTEERAEDFRIPHRATAAGALSSLVRLSYYWIDYVVGYWTGVRRECIAGRSTIFDRYFYDFLVDPRRSRLSLPTWVTRTFLALTPKPDLVFLLDCDPDLVFARKQELPREEIARQLAVYRELARHDPARFVRLDASRRPSDIVAEAMREVVVRAYEKIPDSR